MNSSRYGVGNRSGASQSQNQLKPAKGLWGKLIRFFQTGWLNPRTLYRQSRRLLWVGTTGLIFLIAPFAFSHFWKLARNYHRYQEWVLKKVRELTIKLVSKI